MDYNEMFEGLRSTFRIFMGNYMIKPNAILVNYEALQIMLSSLNFPINVSKDGYKIMDCKVYETLDNSIFAKWILK